MVREDVVSDHFLKNCKLRGTESEPPGIYMFIKIGRKMEILKPTS